MSFFKKLDVTELRKVCEHFAVDFEKEDGKHKLIEKIETDGVTEAMYRKEFNVPEQPAQNAITMSDIEPTPAPAPPATETTHTAPVSVEDRVLLHMTRANGRFDVRGHKFTKDAPYQLVSSADATFIKTRYEGFEVATPQEVANFYDV